MKKAVLVLCLLAACAGPVGGSSPDYLAAYDVSCFMFAAERVSDEQASRPVQRKCFEALKKYFRSAVTQ